MSNRKFFLSHHAIRRVLLRDTEDGVVNLTLTPDEVSELLNENCYVETSQYPIPGKTYNLKFKYWVFYSPQDDYYFIAIGTINPKWNMYEIITVIPVNKKGKWMLTNKMLDEARTLAYTKIGFVPRTFVAQTNPSFKITCTYTLNGQLKVKK